MTRYELSFPMVDETEKQVVVSADNLNAILKAWGDMIRDSGQGDGNRVFICTLDETDPRPAAGIDQIRLALRSR